MSDKRGKWTKAKKREVWNSYRDDKLMNIYKISL
jgi:hypothetical protein